MRELLVINDIATLEAKPQWVPWFTLDGVPLVQDPDNENSTASYREQFLLGKRVCDAYVAKSGKVLLYDVYRKKNTCEIMRLEGPTPMYMSA